MPFGMSRFGSAQFFRRERQLLDGEKQPDRKRHGGKDAVDPEGEERTMAFGQLDCRSGRRIGADVQRVFAEIEKRKRADEEHHENADGEQGHHDRDHERQLDAADIEPDKNDVAEDPPERLERGGRVENRREIGADEVHDHRRGQHIFDVLGDAGDEPPHGPKAVRAKE